MSTECVIEDPRWEDIGLDRLAETAVSATLRHLGLDPDAWDVTVLGCDDTQIARLNAQFRETAKATNVLSWPSMDRSVTTEGATPVPPTGDPELGDIAIAFDTCQQEAAERAIPVENHVIHLIIHGTLHLLGYDHVRDGDGDLMESLETAILCTLGVPNPY